MRRGSLNATKERKISVSISFQRQVRDEILSLVAGKMTISEYVNQAVKEKMIRDIAKEKTILEIVKKKMFLDGY